MARKNESGKTVEVQGFYFREDWGDTQPRVRDIELAEFLEYGQTRDIRKLIKRLESRGLLDVQGVRATVAQGRMSRDRTEFWLTERQAYIVIAKSDTAKADECLGVIIDGFMQWRQGKVFDGVLTAKPCEWSSMWGQTVCQLLCAVHGKVYLSGRIPPMLAPVFKNLYIAQFGQKVYGEMKRRNPKPKFGSNHHQWLDGPMRAKLEAKIPAIADYARMALSHPQPVVSFWSYMEHPDYTDFQLPLFTVRPPLRIS